MYRLLIACLFLTLVLAPTGCQDKSKTSASSGTMAAAKTMTRAEFEKLVIGKTQAEIVAAVGEPYMKASENRWSYSGVTINPATNKVDLSVHVNFENKKAVKVEYPE